MQNLGGQTKSIMVFSEVAYTTLIVMAYKLDLLIYWLSVEELIRIKRV